MHAEDVVTLAHGAGGETEDSLIKTVFLGLFERSHAMGGIGLEALDDGGSIKIGDSEVILNIDGHTVDPLFFPGGDLGRLAVSGTVNDTAVMGAEPVAILDAIICEEGYPLKDLRRLISAINITAKEAEVAIIAGDFKVMPRNSIDGVVICTAGVGILKGKRILDSNAEPGDRVIITGSVGDHGIALMSHREGLEFETELVSDVAPIYPTIKAAMEAGDVKSMKDPTRGGLSMALDDIAGKSGVSIWLDSKKIPIKPSVKAASEMLGLDPYEVTCEGRAVIVASEDSSEEVLQAVRKTEHGVDAQIIGEVRKERPGRVLLRTRIGGTRILRKPLGEPIPRVC